MGVYMLVCTVSMFFPCDHQIISGGKCCLFDPTHIKNGRQNDCTSLFPLIIVIF